MPQRPAKSLEKIFKDDGRYPLEAVQFIREGYSYTVSKFRSEASGAPAAERHVSGEQLCQGLRELAQQRWGRLARSVLNRWRITSTRDFGEIVFLMVHNGYMKKQPEDSVEDFQDVYDFVQTFDRDYQISLGD